MNKKQTFTLILVALATLFVSACTKENNAISGDGKYDVTVNCSILDENITRSSYNFDKCNNIYTLHVAFYSEADGKLVGSGSSETNTLKVSHIPAEPCTVLVVANQPSWSWENELKDELKAVCSGFTATEIEESGLPMSATAKWNCGGSIEIPLIRLASKYEFSINNSVEGKVFTITDVTVKNASNVVYTFDSDNLAEGRENTDQATSGDITSLNDGEKIVLYCPESESARITVKGTWNNGDESEYNLSLMQKNARNVQYNVVLTMDNQIPVWSVNERTDEMRYILFYPDNIALTGDGSPVTVLMRLMPDYAMRMEYGLEYISDEIEAAALEFSSDGINWTDKPLMTFVGTSYLHIRSKFQGEGTSVVHINGKELTTAPGLKVKSIPASDQIRFSVDELTLVDDEWTEFAVNAPEDKNISFSIAGETGDNYGFNLSYRKDESEEWKDDITITGTYNYRVIKGNNLFRMKVRKDFYSNLDYKKGRILYLQTTENGTGIVTTCDQINVKILK